MQTGVCGNVAHGLEIKALFAVASLEGEHVTVGADGAHFLQGEQRRLLEKHALCELAPKQHGLQSRALFEQALAFLLTNLLFLFAKKQCPLFERIPIWQYVAQNAIAHDEEELRLIGGFRPAPPKPQTQA